MSRGRHKDLSGLYRDAAEAIKEKGPLKTSELRDNLWNNGYNGKYKTKKSLHRTLIKKREAIIQNHNIATEKTDKTEGSMEAWLWSFQGENQ